MRVNDLAVDNGELCAVRGAETHPFDSRDTAVAKKTLCAEIYMINSILYLLTLMQRGYLTVTVCTYIQIALQVQNFQ